MKYRKQIILGIIFIAFATVLTVIFFTRNNKFSEYSYVKIGPKEYSQKYGEYSVKNKNIKVYKIKTLESTSKEILKSDKWDDWIKQSEDLVYDDLEKSLLFIGDEEITSSYTSSHNYKTYISKENGNRIYLSYFLEGDNLLYIIEFENKES